MGNLNQKDLKPKDPQPLQMPSHDQGLQDTLKTTKIKPLIINRTQWRCLLSTDITFIRKNKPKMLSTIHITRFNRENLKNRDFNTLCRSLKDTKSISSLITDLPQNPGELPSKNQLGHLLNLTNRWKKLKIFYLHSESTSSTKKITRLARCPNLASLEIAFDQEETPQVEEKIMSRLSQQIRALPKLKNFALEYQIPSMWFSRTIFDYTSVFFFEYPRSLSSLTIKRRHSGRIPEELQAQFTSNLQHLRQLEHLSLDFDITDMKTLLKKSSRLKSLRLPKKFSYNAQEPEPIKSFLQDFSHLKNIVSLDIHFGDYSEEADAYIFPALLSNYLASFPHLKSVKFNISMPRFIGSELPELSPSIHSLTQLEDIELDFMCKNINSYFFECLSQFLQHLPMLKSLKFSLFDLKRSPYNILFLSQSLQKLTHLKKLDLHLHFQSIDFEEASMEVLSKSIAHLPLESLGLHLSGPKPDKTILQRVKSLWIESQAHKLSHLFSTLYNFNLKTLSLNLSNFDLSTPERKGFALALKQLKHLSSLSLILPEFDLTLQDLLSSLMYMPVLTSLFISFEFMGRGLGPKEVFHLASNLRGCRSLEELKLKFGYGNDFGEEIFHYLLSGIASLSRLKNLELLLFGGFPKFNSVFAEKILLQELSALRNLEALRFYSQFKKYPKDPSHEIEQDLEMKLVNHPNLKRLRALHIPSPIDIECL